MRHRRSASYPSLFRARTGSNTSSSFLEIEVKNPATHGELTHPTLGLT